MPTFVDPNKCNACQDEHQGPLCVYICPNDLMTLDVEQNKGFNQEPELCSECFACVKLCPQEAIQARGYADFVPLGALVQPHRTDIDGIENGGLQWEVVFRDGRRFDFTYQSRTRPAGSVVVYEGFTEDPVGDLGNQSLAGDSQWLGVARLPVPAAKAG